MIGRPATSANVEQRSDHVSHLLIEKPVALHVHTNLVTVSFHVAAKNGSDHGFTFTASGRHRGKILPSDKMSRPFTHSLNIQRSPKVMDVTLCKLLHRTPGGIVDSILIELAQRASRGMKVATHVTNLNHGKIVGQSRTDGVSKFVRRQRIGRAKIADVAGRVYPRIGPTASQEIERMTNAAPNRLFQNALDRPQTGLILPAMKLGAVISNLQIDVSFHRSDDKDRLDRRNQPALVNAVASSFVIGC